MSENKNEFETKVIVETVGDLSYFDPYSDAYLEAHRPSLVKFTPFIEKQVEEGKVKILSKGLDKDASEEDFANAIKDSDGDHELAVASFTSESGGEEVSSDDNEESEEVDENTGKKLTKAQKKAKAKADKEAAAKAAAGNQE